jgi:hypothetical protein
MSEVSWTEQGVSRRWICSIYSSENLRALCLFVGKHMVLGEGYLSCMWPLSPIPNCKKGSTNPTAHIRIVRCTTHASCMPCCLFQVSVLRRIASSENWNETDP